ncbi:MAG TPA: cytochrome c [Candidatus Dormibacteraeota bacterium]|nr:cytochrome c [Candidatus Dormibacteraeota bacterium]
MRIRMLAAIFAALALPAAMFAAPKGNAAAGKEVYQAHCQMCHGPNGEGNASLAKMLHATIPPLGSKEVQALSDAQMHEVIEKGKLKMPPVKGLSSADVDNVIAFVRTLAKK